MQPSSAPVEFFVPDQSKSGTKIDGNENAGGGVATNDKPPVKLSLLDLLPPSPKRVPQVDGPGDSDDEEAKIK